MPHLRARKGGIRERLRAVTLDALVSTTAYQSGLRFRTPGSVSMSQNMVVAVKAVDAVDIRIDKTATLLVCAAFSSATS
jgi:hypothetical protein